MRPLHQLARPFLPTTRSISTTLPLFAPPKTKPKSSDEPKVKQQKGGNKASKAPSASQTAAKEAHATKMQRLMVMAIDAPYIGPPPASEEEMARRYQIGRNYVIGCWERHNALNHDLAVKIRMKKYAIKMLPREGQVGDSMLESMEEAAGQNETTRRESKQTSVYGRWRSEALKIDDWNGPPSWRPIPMYTPPIPGFDIEEYMINEDEKS